MKKSLQFLTFLFICLLFTSNLSAQTVVSVVTPGTSCKVALISDNDAASGEYGWWSVWQEMNKTDNTDHAPTAFEARPGSYTLVVYWEDNDGGSDGIALEKIQIGRYTKSIVYSFSRSDFTEWNCLSCPWLCVFDGKDYVKHSEVLKDVTGYANRTTTSTLLDPASVIDGKLKFRIQEEKDEVSHIDQIRLKVGDEFLPVSAAAQSDQALLADSDDQFLDLKKGDQIELEVNLPASWDVSTPISLEVSGYYNPEPEFMASITRKLLKEEK